MTRTLHFILRGIVERGVVCGLLLCTVLAISACASNARQAARNQEAIANLSPEDRMLRTKFRAIYGLVWRIDAASPKKYTTITSEAGWEIDGPALLGPNKVSNLTYTDNSMPIPKTVRVIWREGSVRFLAKGQGTWSGGIVLGDYTVPVAERIPDSILDYIRKNGGALRLKIRLKDDGVLIGWDVEEWYTTQYGRGLRWVMPGGDFREAQIRDGKVIDPGWQK